MRRVLLMLRGPFVLLVLLGLLGYGAYWGYQQFSAPAATATPIPCVMTDVGGKLTPKKVSVRVLNGGTVSGLARQTTTYLRAYGFYIIGYSNADNERITDPVIVGNSVDSPEVRLLLGFFKNSTARADGRTDHTVDVLVGASKMTVEKPPTSVAVDGPVCLPQIPTASASATPSNSPSPSSSKAKKK